MFKYFILPPREVFSEEGPRVAVNPDKNVYMPYSVYNYFQPGVSSFIKKLHFEFVLRLSKRYFNKFSAIDFGCADGILLPSLSKYFKKVFAVDIQPKSVASSEKLAIELSLDNIQFFCNENRTISEIIPLIAGEDYHVLYLLETIEHVGTSEKMYPSKTNFLKEISQLIVDDGIMIVSMPKMVGISYLIQRISLKILGAKVEQIALKDLLKAVFLSDTANLEKDWHPHAHLGFNHKYLRRLVVKEFKLLRTVDIGFQAIWVLGKK